MKEIQPKIKDKIEQIKQTKAESQFVLLGTIKPKNGHTLFEINKDTFEINKAEFIQKNISFVEAKKGNISVKKDVLVKDGFIYISALNKQNALKKLNKL